ncbi:signal peptidase I [Patescibacteria group bacterium]
MKEFLIGVFGVLFMSPFNIQGDSMEPTFSHDDYIMFETLTYIVEEPVRGDVVVFYGTDESEKVFVKRIVGMPGETLILQEGKVYIDEELLEEPYMRIYSDSDDNEEFNFREHDGVSYEVPQGKYFMLGDNRKNSFDSRTWNDPFVPHQSIFGKYYFNIN